MSARELPEGIDPKSGLTADELRTVDLTVETWNALRNLDSIVGDDMRDASQAIRTIQRIIASRAMARLFPEVWR